MALNLTVLSIVIIALIVFFSVKYSTELLILTKKCPLYKPGGGVYFSQYFEDYILSIVFQGNSSGFYIDVGANNPEVDNVTKYFYNRGWKGINIEPNLTLYKIITASRPDDNNINVGISDSSGELIFYEVTDHMGLSTFDRSTAEQAKKRGYGFKKYTVPVTTLNNVIEDNNVKKIDILKIDVEGYEKQVLNGLDLKKYRPTVILLEATVPCTFIPNHFSWEPILLANSYNFVLFDGINRYYLSSESTDLFGGFEKAYFCIRLVNKKYRVIDSAPILGSLSK